MRETERRERPPRAQEDRRNLLDSAQKEEMLAVLIRSRRAHEQVRAVLKRRHVATISRGHALLWRVVCDFYEAHQALPTRKQIKVEISGRVGSNGYLTDDQQSDLDSFIDGAFDDKEHGCNIGRSRSHREQAVSTCQQFIAEAEAAQFRESVFQDGTIPFDMPALLEQHRTRIIEASSLTDGQHDVLFTKGWDVEAGAELVSTGVSALNELVGGGLAGGEVLTFMAPYGTCKTVTAVQAACNTAERASKMFMMGNTHKGKKPVVVLISTEMTAMEFRLRALSCAARVPWKRLREAIGPSKGMHTLSHDPRHGASPETQYELVHVPSEGFICEFNRVRGAMRMMNEHCVFLECTDANKDCPATAMIGMRGIQNWVRAIFRAQKNIYPIAFILDHASALANKIVTADGGKREHLRYVLREIPQFCGEYLAKPYGVPMTVYHQLNGEANSRGPTVEMHHTDSADCKAFVEFADFAVVCGTATETEERLAKWVCTKHRREPPCGHLIVQIMGQFNNVVDRSRDYTVSQREFIKIDDIRKGEEAAAERSAKAIKRLDGIGG